MKRFESGDSVSFSCMGGMDRTDRKDVEFPIPRLSGNIYFMVALKTFHNAKLCEA